MGRFKEEHLNEVVQMPIKVRKTGRLGSPCDIGGVSDRVWEEERSHPTFDVVGHRSSCPNCVDDGGVRSGGRIWQMPSTKARGY